MPSDRFKETSQRSEPQRLEPSSLRAEPGLQLSITERELFERLGWFTQIRWALGLFYLLTLLVSYHVFGVRFRWGDVSAMPEAAGVVLVIFLYNAAFAFVVHILRARARAGRRTIVALALGQISCDVLAICLLAHFTGGIENVFIILVLLPLVIATELMPQGLAYAVAAGTAVLINLLAWGEQQHLWPHVHVELADGGSVGGGAYSDPLYVLQATTALSATIFAMVFIASTIAARLRSRESQLEQAYRDLNASDETKSFFMRKAGHELRAPLSAIHSVLDAITQGDETLTRQQRRLIGRARNRTRGLLSLVGDLRRYSRLRSGQTPLQMRRAGLDQIVRNTVELFRGQADAADVEITCSAATAWVRGEEELLREMVTNLVSNAIQYTPAGGKVCVELAVRRPMAVFSVSDTGMGISEKALPCIFGEFYRAPEAKKAFTQGTGLGLAIVKRIVTMHGGGIEVASQPGDGTTFTVRLPLEGAGQAGRETKAPDGSGPTGSA